MRTLLSGVERGHRNILRDLPDAPICRQDAKGPWVLRDRELVLALLRDDRFNVVDYGLEISDLGARHGVGVAALSGLLDQSPLTQEGQRHAELRRKAALLLAQMGPAGQEAFEATFSERLATGLARSGTFDLFADLMAPSITALLNCIFGLEGCPVHGDLSPSQAFGLRDPISRRRLAELDAKATEILEWAGRTDAPDVPMMRAGLRVTATDPVLGSLSASLAHELERNPGVPLSRIDWSASPQLSSLPYVERVAVEDAEIGGCQIRAGERVNVYLGGLDPGDVALLFGAGRHLCIGRAISLDLWRRMTRLLARHASVLTVESVQYRQYDLTFVFPNQILARVTHV